jgi:hypothetical protein
VLSDTNLLLEILQKFITNDINIIKHTSTACLNVSECIWMYLNVRFPLSFRTMLYFDFFQLYFDTEIMKLGGCVLKFVRFRWWDWQCETAKCCFETARRSFHRMRKLNWTLLSHPATLHNFSHFVHNKLFIIFCLFVNTSLDWPVMK